MLKAKKQEPEPKQVKKLVIRKTVEGRNQPQRILANRADFSKPYTYQDGEENPFRPKTELQRTFYRPTEANQASPEEYRPEVKKERS